MAPEIEIAIRKATPGDSRVLAELMNMAGDGIPAYLWERMAQPGEDVMQVGARRVARLDGGFSYTNIHVACVAGEVAGMLLGYRLPDPYETGPLDDYPEAVRPAIELEALVPGSWYINAIATAPSHRGRRIGTRLMALAERLAAEAGADRLSLIVSEGNRAAIRLYTGLGYTTIARRPSVPVADFPHAGDWLLMDKPVLAMGRV